MSVTVAKLAAVVLLSAQFLPLGLPLVCENVRHDPATTCEQQMALEQTVALDGERGSPVCLDTALCPTHVTAVPAFHATVRVLAGDAVSILLVSSDFTPQARQAPLPPPPKA